MSVPSKISARHTEMLRFHPFRGRNSLSEPISAPFHSSRGNIPVKTLKGIFQRKHALFLLSLEIIGKKAVSTNNLESRVLFTNPLPFSVYPFL